MRKGRNKKTVLIVVLLLVVGTGLLGFNNLSGLFGGPGAAARSTREVAMSCTLDMYTQFHIHPRLTTVVNGEPQTVPASIGITLGCMHPIHTHDASGSIHVESPEQRDFTLGDFFAVWGQAFNKNEISTSGGDYKTDANHEIVMTVDGKTSDQYENLVLKDLQQIAIEYKVVNK